jgi:TetR/AcrR family transcriptional regulator
MSAGKVASKRGVRKRQPEKVRESAVQAALSVFAADGYDGTSMQQIADEAGVSLPLIVYHFKSKEKLWQAAVSCVVEQFDQLMAAAMSDETKSSPTEQLRAIIEAFVRVSVQFPQVRRMMAMESYAMTPRLQWMGEHYARRHHKAIIDLIVRGQKAGDVVKIEPHRLSFLIVDMATLTSSAAEYQYLTGRDPFSSKEVKATIRSINTIVFTSEQ